MTAGRAFGRGSGGIEPGQFILQRIQGAAGLGLAPLHDFGAVFLGDFLDLGGPFGAFFRGEFGGHFLGLRAPFLALVDEGLDFGHVLVLDGFGNVGDDLFAFLQELVGFSGLLNVSPEAAGAAGGG